MYFYPESIREMTLEVEGREGLDQYVSGSCECFWNWISTFLWVVLTLISKKICLCCSPAITTLWLSCTLWKITCVVSSTFPGPPRSSLRHYLANPEKPNKRCHHAAIAHLHPCALPSLLLFPLLSNCSSVIIEFKWRKRQRRMFFLCCVNMLPLKALVVLMGQFLNYQDWRGQEREVEKQRWEWERN